MKKTEKSYIIYNVKNIYFTITYINVKNMSLKVKDTIQVVSSFYHLHFQKYLYHLS